jgi:hypothetical protein
LSLIQNVLKELPEDFPDYHGFIKLRDQLDGLFFKIDVRKKQVDFKKDVDSLRNSIENNSDLQEYLPNLSLDYEKWKDDFQSLTSKYKIWGNESFINYQFNQSATNRIQVVLLSRVLLILDEVPKPSKCKFHLLYAPINVGNIELLEIPDVGNAKHLFQIKSKKNGMIHILQCSNEEQKNSWISMLKSLKQKELAQQTALAKPSPKPNIIKAKDHLGQLRYLNLFAQEFAEVQNLSIDSDLKLKDPGVSNVRCKIHNCVISNGKPSYDEIGICLLSLPLHSEQNKLQLVVSIEQTGRLFVNAWAESIEHIQVQETKRIFLLCPVTSGKLCKLLVNFKDTETRDKMYEVLKKEKDRKDAKMLVKSTALNGLENELLTGEELVLEHYDYSNGYDDFVPDNFDLTNDLLIFQAWMSRLVGWKEMKWRLIETGQISLYAKDNEFVRFCYQKHGTSIIPVNNIVRFYSVLEVIGDKYIGLVFQDSIVKNGKVHKMFIVELASAEITSKIVKLFQKYKVCHISDRDFNRMLEECHRTMSSDELDLESRVEKLEITNGAKDQQKESLIRQILQDAEDIKPVLTDPKPISVVDQAIKSIIPSYVPSTPKKAVDEVITTPNPFLAERKDPVRSLVQAAKSDAAFMTPQYMPQERIDLNKYEESEESSANSFKTCEGEDSKLFNYYDCSSDSIDEEETDTDTDG